MTQHTNRLPVHTSASGRADRRSAHTPSRSPRRPSTRLISEAVVASYLHDISQRHRDDAHVSGAQTRRREYLA
jgi:hypothetical protein